MATNFFENTLPDLSTGADIPALLATFAGSTGQYVQVESRTEAEQRRAQKGVGTGTLTVFRTDLPNGGAFETHPNTGAPGEVWTQQTNKALTAGEIGTTQGGTVQSLLNTVLGGLSGLPAIAWSNTPFDVIGSRPETFDTGSVSFAGPGVGGVNLPFAGTPAVFIGGYIATNGTVVQTSIPFANATGFTIRVKRNGYSTGAVTFPWIAIGPSA